MDILQIWNSVGDKEFDRLQKIINLEIKDVQGELTPLRYYHMS